MKTVIKYASDYKRIETTEINSLEDLLKLYKAKGNALVIRTESEMVESEYISDMIASKAEYLAITVYDDYME
jgi:light-regulated signal transduction histidine kinase (bacteriophytochrome)